MRSRRELVRLILPLLACGVACAAEAFQDFVHISDTHVMELSAVHPKIRTARQHFNGSSASLPLALKHLNGAAFVVFTGDLIDSYSFDGATAEVVYGQIDVFKSIYTASPLPVFAALGNHDVQRYRLQADKPAPRGDQSVSADARRAWTEALSCFRDGTYYSFRKQVGATEYAFLVLDNGESSTKNPDYAEQQSRWLKQQLAANRERSVILVMHIPLQEDSASGWIRKAILDAENVVLALAGHRHSDAVEEVEVGNRRLIQVRTAAFGVNDKNVRRIRLLENRIEVSATAHPEQLIKTVALLVPAGARP